MINDPWVGLRLAYVGDPAGYAWYSPGYRVFVWEIDGAPVLIDTVAGAWAFSIEHCVSPNALRIHESVS